MVFFVSFCRSVMVQNVCFVTFSANFRYDSLKFIKSGGESDLGRFELIRVLKCLANELVKTVECFEVRLECDNNIRAYIRLVSGKNFLDVRLTASGRNYRANAHTVLNVDVVYVVTKKLVR